jgi:hypothetical protein
VQYHGAVSNSTLLQHRTWKAARTNNTPAADLESSPHKLRPQLWDQLLCRHSRLHGVEETHKSGPINPSWCCRLQGGPGFVTIQGALHTHTYHTTVKPGRTLFKSYHKFVVVSAVERDKHRHERACTSTHTHPLTHTPNKHPLMQTHATHTHSRTHAIRTPSCTRTHAM